MRANGQKIRRVLFFVIGTVILNFGAAVTIQANFGASCSLALPYAISLASGIPLSRLVIVVYSLEVAAQFMIRRKKQWRDILQIPLALFLSALLEVFQKVDFGCDLVWERVLLMLLGLICIGMGVFLSVNMRIIPAPPEGLLDALTQRTGKNMGLVKNLQDGAFVGTALLVDLIFRRRIDAVGLATVCSVVLVGRIVALCSKLFLKRLLAAAGLPENQKK